MPFFTLTNEESLDPSLMLVRRGATSTEVDEAHGSKGAIPLLRLEGITKWSGPLEVNSNISLSIASGEVHAIVGENGAGKTTLMNILYGIYQADAGTIFVAGRPVVISSPANAIEHGISLVSQHFLLVERHTVAENLALALPGLGFRFSQRRIAELVAPLTSDYGLVLNIKAKVSDLSPGERQRLEIAKALLRESRVIILDEPTSVLTPQEAHDLFQILDSLRANGCANFLYLSQAGRGLSNQ